MNRHDIKIFDSADDLADYLTSFLLEKINETPVSGFFSLALSGGSTPKILFRHIAGSSKEKTNWGKVKIFWGDERCVPPDHEDSNYNMANNEFLRFLNIPEDNIFRIFGEAEPSGEAERYSRIIENNVIHKDGIPRFDLILLGLGEDGHTASIFPDNMSSFDSDLYCEAVTHPRSGQKRVTLSGKLINSARLIIFMVSGKNKAGIVSEIIQSEHNSNYPAALVNPWDGELLWLLDKEAASMLA